MPEQSPLHPATLAAGAMFGEVAGWLLPLRFPGYGSPDSLAQAPALLFDVSHRSKVELRGNDRASFLQNFCTNDVVKLSAGAGCEAFLTTGQAKIVARLLVYASPDALWIDADPGSGPKIVQHLERFVITEQVELLDRTKELAQLHVAEQGAGTIVAERGTPSGPELEEFRYVERSLAGASCQVRRNDVLGRPGYDVLCAADQAGGVWRVLTQRGARPTGLEHYESLRVETGTPEYGRDIDESNLPQEVGRDARAISFTKGCYLGQETVARIKAYGHVNRSLVGLRLDGPTPPPSGTKVMRDGQEVGRVTSSAFSPRFGCALALAYVRRGLHEPGTELVTADGSATSRVVVSRLPFDSP